MTKPARQTVEFRTPPCRDLAIYFDSNMPPEVRDAWDAVLPDIMGFFTRDLRELSLGWDADRAGAFACINRSANYRFARICICPGFLELDQRRRLQSVLHEVAHMWLAEYDQSYREALKAMMPDAASPSRALAESLRSHEEERLVEELSWLFLAMHEGRVTRRVAT